MKHAVAVLALLAGLATAGDAVACACCADPGTWYESRMAVGRTERADLAKLRFTTGRRMETPKEGGFEPFRLRTTLSGRTWRWHLGNPATLTLRVPTSATTLAADIHDGKLAGGGGPLLYRELRLEGALSTSDTILRGTHYRLVLQGRGNNCLNAGDFRSWHLEITGHGARYQLYGTFR